MKRTVAVAIIEMLLLASCAERLANPNSTYGSIAKQQAAKSSDKVPTPSPLDSPRRIPAQSDRVEREFRGHEQGMIDA